MRKVAFSILAGFIFALIVSSCSRHKACAAYSKVEVEQKYKTESKDKG